MPPRRKASGTASPTVIKRPKTDEEKSVDKKITELLKVVEEKKHSIDQLFPQPPGHTCRIHEAYNCALNQTNIQQNNNKFYIIQLIVIDQSSPVYSVWTRWGRVGEPGQSAQLGPFHELNKAVAAFEKKFADKTGNKWSQRANFVYRSGKYDLVDVVDAASDPVHSVEQKSSAFSPLCSLDVPSKLDSATLLFIQRIFDRSMFEFTMKEMQLDVHKMPLGKLSAKQIASAFEVLTELGEVLQHTKEGDIGTLSSRFYTLFPHACGRQRPPPITDMIALRSKLDMLLILSDVVLTQGMQEEVKPVKNKVNVLDAKYNLLECELQWLNEHDTDRKHILEFFNTTGDHHYKILNVWRVNRAGEAERYKTHHKLTNRRLLWHGTSVAVVAAILKTGLRILPHSGGLVGKGIYFASLAAKSQGYGLPDADGHRVMFLAEVALGNPHSIYQSDSSIKQPPAGYDSVIAEGRSETTPDKCVELRFQDSNAKAFTGSPVQRNNNSQFYQSEYLIYRESQCRLRFVIEYIHT